MGELTESQPLIYCRNPEEFGDGSPIYLLPTKRPTWWLQNDLPWMTHDELCGVIQGSLDAWSAVCDVKGSQAASADVANFLITVASIDGEGRVLADMQLPNPSLRQQRMRIDVAEERLRHLLPAILTHEFGHAFALQHFPVGPPAELMEPALNPAVTSPQPTESALMAKWYGLPIPMTPVPTPGGGQPIVCTMRVEPGSGAVRCAVSVQQGNRKAELTGEKIW